MKTTKTAKEKLAGLVRVISIPPVMVTALLLILYFWGPQPFCPVGELVTTILLLGFVPVLAYPAQPLFPPLPQPRPGGSAGAGVCLYRGGVYHCLFVGAAGGGLAGDPHHLCRVFFLGAVPYPVQPRASQARQRARVQRGRAAFVPHLLLWLVDAAAQYCDRVAGGVGFGGT